MLDVETMLLLTVLTEAAIKVSVFYSKFVPVETSIVGRITFCVVPVEGSQSVIPIGARIRDSFIALD